MNKKLTLAVMTMLLTLNAASGLAGTFNGSEWKSTACEAEPVAPIVDMSTRQTYNRSVSLMQGYDYAMLNYFKCVITESNADAAMITKLMAEKVQKLKEMEDKFSADAAAAELRFQQAVP